MTATALPLPGKERITQSRILVVGDVMLDRYWHGDVARISPEAPVPVVQVKREELRLGGAANVALNIRTLGAQVTLLSAVGVDEVGAGSGLHVGVESVGQAHLLPDPRHLLVGGDGPGAEVDVRVPLDDHHVEPLLPQQVGCGGAHRAIADDRDVVVRLFGHSGLAPACSVVIVTVM